MIRREKDMEPVVRASVKAAFRGRCFTIKTHPDMYEGGGKPDIIACCYGMMVGIELKKHPGRPSPSQKSWLKMINDAGGFGCFIVYRDGKFYLVLPWQVDEFSYKKSTMSTWQELKAVKIGDSTYLNLEPLKLAVHLNAVNNSKEYLNG